MSDVILRTENLSKAYGSFLAVDRIDLNVRQGEVFGFLGPNGAGKTTTIAVLLGLMHATAGKVEIFGQKVTPGRTQALRNVGSLVGDPGLIPHLSGRENLRLLAKLNGIEPTRVEEVLEIVDMTQAADRKFGGYSMGMKQRLGLAAALLHRPKLLILDEPTNGLDPAGMREIRELLRKLAEQGITVFLSSHLLHEVEQVCDRVAVLKEGRIVAEGTVSELLGNQKMVKAWVSNPKAAAEVLRTLPQVKKVSPNGVYVEIEGAPSERVIETLVEHGMTPSEVLYRKSDLEHIFLELTQ
jgi:ABC-type multidrug transport system ATPase subunit